MTTNFAEMKPRADEIADLMKTMAHANRLLALCALGEREYAVTELAEAIGMRAQAMSQQLAILRNKGLVSTRRDGQTVYYSLASDRLRAFMAALNTIYCQPGDAP
jgi:DNA-binding transcriptional ArsR family regulator